MSPATAPQGWKSQLLSAALLTSYAGHVLAAPGLTVRSKAPLPALRMPGKLAKIEIGGKPYEGLDMIKQISGQWAEVYSNMDKFQAVRVCWSASKAVPKVANQACLVEASNVERLKGTTIGPELLSQGEVAPGAIQAQGPVPFEGGVQAVAETLGAGTSLWRLVDGKKAYWEKFPSQEDRNKHATEIVGMVVEIHRDEHSFHGALQGQWFCFREQDLKPQKLKVGGKETTATFVLITWSEGEIHWGSSQVPIKGLPRNTAPGMVKRYSPADIFPDDFIAPELLAMRKNILALGGEKKQYNMKGNMDDPQDWKSYYLPQKLRRDHSWANVKGQPVDVYAMGVNLYLIFANKMPAFLQEEAFLDGSVHDRRKMIKEGTDEMTDEQAEVIEMALTTDPERRPSIHKVAEKLEQAV